MVLHMETIDYKQYTVSFTEVMLYVYNILSTFYRRHKHKVLPGASTKKPPLARGNMNLTGLYREGWGSDRVCSCMALCLYGS